MESEIKFIPDAEHLVQELPNLFKRRGKENNYKTNFEMKKRSTFNTTEKAPNCNTATGAGGYEIQNFDRTRTY